MNTKWDSWRHRLRDFRPVSRVLSKTAPPVLVAVLTWFMVGSVFAISLYSQRVAVQVGGVAPRTVVAPFGVVDWPATYRARALAESAVRPVYTTKASVLKEVNKENADDFTVIENLMQDTAVPILAREQEAEQLIPIGLPLTVWGEILTLSPAHVAQLQQDTSVIMSSVLGNNNGVRNTAVSLAEAKSFIGQLADQEELDPGIRLFISSLADSLLRPNTFPNVALTNARSAALANAVPLVRILKGQQVLVQGQTVTQADVQLLQELGLLNTGFDPNPLVGGLLFGLVLVATLSGYIWAFRRRLLEQPPALIITGIITVAAMVAAETLTVVPGANFVIVPTAAIMLAALIDPGVAIVSAGLLALAAGVVSSTNLTTAIVALFGALAGVVGVSRLSARYDVVRVGLLVGLVNLLGLLGLDFMEGASLIQAPVWHQLMWSFVDGGLAAMLAVGSAPFLEAPFGIVTAMRLIELSNPNQPLLRKLLVEAPGTYQHSIMVGNLAEQAAEAVGGNSLLARVGAIYHDIGKVKRPYFFIDNQFGAENPHDKLSPSLSALIISSHVRDGLELAQENRMPLAIQDFIRQHHGTTVMRYFYEKARDQDTGEGVLEEDFRYDGPKPQTKETAIVMLADASEATSRTLKNPTPVAIEQVVRRLIKERLTDGQLDEANLTLKELDVIARTFTRVLTGVFHQRIEYPDRVLKEMERSRGRGGVGSKSARIVRRMGGNGPTGTDQGAR